MLLLCSCAGSESDSQSAVDVSDATRSSDTDDMIDGASRTDIIIDEDAPLADDDGGQRSTRKPLMRVVRLRKRIPLVMQRRRQTQDWKLRMQQLSLMYPR